MNKKAIREYNWINGFFLALAILSIVNYGIFLYKQINFLTILFNIISFVIGLSLAFQKQEVKIYNEIL